MGSSLASKSSELFAKGGPALGFMLDAVNSSAAERLGRQMGLRFVSRIPEEISRVKQLKVQYYCPGHCGWHISGQTKLFQILGPEEIGMSVNDTTLGTTLANLGGPGCGRDRYTQVSTSVLLLQGL